MQLHTFLKRKIKEIDHIKLFFPAEIIGVSSFGIKC